MNLIQNIKQNKKLLCSISLGSAAAIFAIYSAIIHFKSNNNLNELQDQSDIENYQLNTRILYQTNIQDKYQFDFINYPIQRNQYLLDLNYKIILNLNKGNHYQGVVKISFNLKSLKSIQGIQFKLNYNGSSIKYLNVNGILLEPEQLKYQRHIISFEKKYLKENFNNKIEVIFENKYSFLDQGLSSYFILDDNNKYSLKEQVIYTKNGSYEIERIVPCINCLNQCKVSLQLIYPEGFQAFFNQPKSLDRPCTVQQYPQYSFFFAAPQRNLNKSITLNSSFTSSNFDNSTLNASSQTKRNSHFFPSSLSSIHNFFVLSSNLIQLPFVQDSAQKSKILIRYFCKSNKYNLLVKHLSTLHRHILDVCARFSDLKIQKYITKLDIFFLADRQIHGYYTKGAIILDDESLQNGLSIKTFYLVARAIIGNPKQIINNPITLQNTLLINWMIAQKFPQSRAYLYFKQYDFENIKKMLNKKQLINKLGLRFKQYHYKQIKFLLNQDKFKQLQNLVSFQFKDIMQRLKNNDSNTYWNYFITQYNFLPSYLAQIILKISINKKGIPFDNRQIINYAKQNFTKSKFYLDFFTNQQIKNNLPIFIQKNTHHLQKRLTEFNILQKHQFHVTQKYTGYLSVKQNKRQAKTIYEQFKRFKQNRNFHHISIMKHQIKRIQMFGKDFIIPENLSLQCGLMSWKMLRKIKIYPVNEEYKIILKELEGDNDEIIKKNRKEVDKGNQLKVKK